MKYSLILKQWRPEIAKASLRVLATRKKHSRTCSFYDVIIDLLLLLTFRIGAPG